jgi:hypothetical protein
VEKFWKKYDIKMATDNIGKAWSEVNQSCMKGVWKILAWSY